MVVRVRRDPVNPEPNIAPTKRTAVKCFPDAKARAVIERGANAIQINVAADDDVIGITGINGDGLIVKALKLQVIRRLLGSIGKGDAKAKVNAQLDIVEGAVGLGGGSVN